MRLAFEATHPETGDPLKVEAIYYPRRRGSRDIYGAPEEPDDEEEVLIKSVESNNKQIYFADIEAELERIGLEHHKQLKRSN